MKAEHSWVNFVKSHHGTAKNAQVNESHSEENVLCDLSHFGIIGISGEDSQNFLQNQLCNDVRKINVGQNQLNAYCTPKGRVLALFRLLQHGKHYLLHLPASNIESTIKRLKMFVLMSDVTINDESDHLVSVGISGSVIHDYVNKNLMKLPIDIDQSSHDEKITAIRIPGINPRYILFGENDDMQPLWEKITAQFHPTDKAVWSTMDIQSGLPQVYATTADAFVPQMLNLHSINGLSFQKGCYPGQEVVARMHYLGKLKRRMYLGHIASGATSERPPQPGDNLVTVGTESDQSVGKIVDSSSNVQGGTDFLAVMQISAVESGDISLDDSNKTPVIFKDLPYSVEISRDKG